MVRGLKRVILVKHKDAIAPERLARPDTFFSASLMRHNFRLVMSSLFFMADADFIMRSSLLTTNERLVEERAREHRTHRENEKRNQHDARRFMDMVLHVL